MNRRKWYDIAWRVPGWLVMTVGLCIYVFGVFATYGPREARKVWRDV